MAVRLQSMALVGLGARPITVEVDLAAGLPSFQIVGLPDKAVDEAKERVRAAIRNSGFQFPVHRITVNLAPADFPKTGPVFDLPIALGVLAAAGVIKPSGLEKFLCVGELALNGDIGPVDGILPMLLSLNPETDQTILLPADNQLEAEVVANLSIYPARTLSDLVTALGNQTVEPVKTRGSVIEQESVVAYPDIGSVAGLTQVKRVLEIAAAGGHNLLMVGPPGTGKTLLARTFAGLLPQLSQADHLEILSLRSSAGLLKKEDLAQRYPPLRHPHHTASPVAVVGGGSRVRPGEASLAHHGVLFLDELPEFPRMVLEALREPLEDGQITIARAQGAITFPARFILLAAANPCPCGYYGDPDRPCQCAPHELARYQRKFSGPLLDRLDLMVTVPRQSTTDLLNYTGQSQSEIIRQRVIQARAKQAARYEPIGRTLNSQLTAGDIRTHLHLEPEVETLIIEAGERLHLSGRAVHRLLKVAQTIADLSEEEIVRRDHLAEALSYRQFGRS